MVLLMNRLTFLAVVCLSALAPPAGAAGSSVLDELAQLEAQDFELSGVLTAESYMGHDYKLSVPELGDMPAILDGGRDLRRQVEETCLSRAGCEVIVTGRFEFAFPVVAFSIDHASSAAHRQKDARTASEIAPCWNVGALSTEAMKTNVTIAFEIKGGRPVPDTIRYVTGSKPESDPVMRESFEAARRAVLRCGARGFSSLPDGTTEITFDAASVTVR